MRAAWALPRVLLLLLVLKLGTPSHRGTHDHQIRVSPVQR